MAGPLGLSVGKRSHAPQGVVLEHEFVAERRRDVQQDQHDQHERAARVQEKERIRQ